MTVLVAGGAGFIGSHLCESLLNQSYKVVCVDNLITGNKNNLNKFLKNPDFIFIAQNISESLSNLIPHLAAGQITSIDYVFHLASPASPNKKSPRSYISFPIETLLVNSVGTHNLLELAKHFNSKFLYASSSEIYGDPALSPQSENYFGNVNPNGVRSVYDDGKRFGEAITMAYVRKYNLDARIIRIFNTYGPVMQKDDGRVVSNFIAQAIVSQPITVYGRGTQTRSFCYVDDMVSGIKAAMFASKTKGGVFNLGNPDEKTILGLANFIKQMTNSSSEIVFEELPQDDPKSRKPDISHAKNILGWEPKINIEQGLERTITYFKKL